MTGPAELRSAVERSLAENDTRAALADLRTLWASDAGPAAAGFVLARLPRVAELIRAVPYKVVILRTFTVEPCVPLLRAAAGLQGLSLDVQVGPFGVLLQELLDPRSATHAFAPDCIVIAAQLCELSPALSSGFADLRDAEVTTELERVRALYADLIAAARAHTQASIVLHSLEVPRPSSSGLLDHQSAGGQADAVRRLNDELKVIARSYPGIVLLDFDGLVAQHGRNSWWDGARYASTRMPFSTRACVAMANAWHGAFVALSGRGCKLLALDLDNTLWGGLAGEEGLRVALDGEHPGAAFVALQRAALDLYQRGVLLAICSKNNEADAMDVIERHPGMVLRPAHLAALRINWDDKAANLRSIAEELGIGLDAVAFVDDNPVERRWVRMQLPEVAVIDLPDDPYSFATTLRACPLFERHNLTREDKARGGYYAAERLRNELQSAAPSLQDYYRSLQMKLELSDPVASRTRLAQLTQRTNQFNLTTRRRSEQEFEQVLASSKHRVVALRVLDRFGDNGIVALAIAELCAPLCEIDTLLMSCRVIGRAVETALLSLVAMAAAQAGSTTLAGRFVPTAKNAPARDFFVRHGFRCVQEEPDGSTRWELPVVDAPPLPPWFQMHGEAK